MHLWQKILIGMILGIAVGSIFGDYAKFLEPLGTIFIQLIKMLVVPLVFSSLVAGVTSMKDPATMGRIGIKTIGAYLVTTAFAIVIGLALGSLFNIGAGFEMNLEKNTEVLAQPTVVERLLDIIPVNPISAFAEGNILQIIFFALLLGASAALLGEKAEPIIKANNALAEIMYKMTNIVMAYAPIGVFGLMAAVAATHGFSILKQYGGLSLSLLAGVIIQSVFIYGGGIKLFIKENPLIFFKKIFNAQSVAFTTSSSSATLPVTMKVAKEKLGVSEGTSSFVLPLGATINMDGTALYQGICVMFVANSLGITLSSGDLVTVMLTATLASIGTAGIPGAGIIMLSLVLSSVGLPVEAIGIIIGIDRVLDMLRTAVNVTGDCFVSMLIDKSEGTFDEGKYLL